MSRDNKNRKLKKRTSLKIQTMYILKLIRYNSKKSKTQNRIKVEKLKTNKFRKGNKKKIFSINTQNRNIKTQYRILD